MPRHVGIWKQDNELFVADAGQKITFSHLCLNNLSKSLQSPVACFVTKGIVNFPKVVNILNRIRQTTLVTSPAVELFRYAAVVFIAAVHLGQAIQE